MSSGGLFYAGANGLPHPQEPLKFPAQKNEYDNATPSSMTPELPDAHRAKSAVLQQRSRPFATRPLPLIFTCPLSLSLPHPISTFCAWRSPEFLVLPGLCLESSSCLILPFLFNSGGQTRMSFLLKSPLTPWASPSLIPTACGLPWIRIFFVHSA